MPKPSLRLRKIADLIQQQLALILKREINDPRLSTISLTGVEVSPDLSRAKQVFYFLQSGIG